MTSTSQSAVQRFITSARELFAEEQDPAERWKKMTPLLEALIGDRSIKEQSKDWPACRQGDELAQNLLFSEEPAYQFVINGLIKSAQSRTHIHVHAHVWTLYVVLDGLESSDRYVRIDDGAKPDYAD